MLPPGEFDGMSFQSHVSHWRVLPLGEFTVFTVTIPKPHATLQGAVSWRNQYRATLQGVRIQSAILKIVFRHILFFVFNAVYNLTSGGFLIVSYDTLVISTALDDENIFCCFMCHFAVFLYLYLHFFY